MLILTLIDMPGLLISLKVVDTKKCADISNTDIQLIPGLYQPNHTCTVCTLLLCFIFSVFSLFFNITLTVCRSHFRKDIRFFSLFFFCLYFHPPKTPERICESGIILKDCFKALHFFFLKTSNTGS